MFSVDPPSPSLVGVVFNIQRCISNFINKEILIAEWSTGNDHVYQETSFSILVIYKHMCLEKNISGICAVGKKRGDYVNAPAFERILGIFIKRY